MRTLTLTLTLTLALAMAGCTNPQPATNRPAMPIVLTCQHAACHADGTQEYQCK
jgi:hypothetical protein